MNYNYTTYIVKKAEKKHNLKITDYILTILQLLKDIIQKVINNEK